MIGEDDLQEQKLLKSGVANKQKDIAKKILPLRTTKPQYSMEDTASVRY